MRAALVNVNTDLFEGLVTQRTRDIDTLSQRVQELQVGAGLLLTAEGALCVDTDPLRSELVTVVSARLALVVVFTEPVVVVESVSCATARYPDASVGPHSVVAALTLPAVVGTVLTLIDILAAARVGVLFVAFSTVTLEGAEGVPAALLRSAGGGLTFVLIFAGIDQLVIYITRRAPAKGWGRWWGWRRESRGGFWKQGNGGVSRGCKRLSLY